MTLSKEKFEHILAYAKQQQKLGVHHCNILPDDMVEIMEMAEGKLERRERDKHVSLGLLSVQQARPLTHGRQIHSSDDCDGCSHYRSDICHGEKCAAPPAETISNSADIAIDEPSQLFGNSEQLNSPAVPDGWIAEAEKLAELHGLSFVIFRPGEQPRCSDPTKVVISFTDKGLGHQPAEQKQEPNQ